MPRIDPTELARTDPRRSAAEIAIERADFAELLPLAEALLAEPTPPCEASPLWDDIARALARRGRERREALLAFATAAAAEGDAPGRAWVRARLLAVLGEGEAALAAWDRVVERGIGARVERHLARGRARLDAGDVDGAWSDLREAFRDPAGYAEMERGTRLLRRLRAHPMPALRQVRVGLLGASTTQLLKPLFELACFRDGIDAEIYEAEYGLYRQELLDPGSGLRSFRPDVVILATGHREAGLAPVSADPEAELRRIVDGFAALWRVCNEELRAHVVQHDFDVPLVDSYGHLSAAHPGGRARLLRRANEALREAAPAGVSIVDFEGLAAEAGKASWFDPRLWHLAKQHPAPAALPLLVDAWAAQLRAVLGLTRKVLALDLDDTLWGGIVGEDGVDGLEIGGHSPVGEAHAELQAYARELRERGVVLTVCSKNNEADAREPFERHPEMLLGLEDFAVFKANWQDKATNLRETAAALGLGLDSFVFLDDNPTERAWVRSQLPEVAVPEIGDDPARFLERLQRHRYFDALTLSDEDRLRAQDYAANAQRAELAQSAGTLEEFLASLDMSAAVGAFDQANLPRITQLVNKSNQFNLTTRRLTGEQLQALAGRPDHVTRWFRLRDRFADNGLVGVMIGRLPEGSDRLEIDLWLMSCRVLGRRMEELMCGVMMDAALEHGVEKVLGRYIPTAKNGMVADLYERLGFDKLGAGEAEGETLWVYDLSQKPPVRNDFIRIESA